MTNLFLCLLSALWLASCGGSGGDGNKPLGDGSSVQREDEK